MKNVSFDEFYQIRLSPEPWLTKPQILNADSQFLPYLCSDSFRVTLFKVTTVH